MRDPTEQPFAQSQATDAPSEFASELARWGFFLSGIVLVIAAAILPLQADLEWTHHQRDLALIVEQDNLARNASYQRMIDAIQNKDPDTLHLLAQSNLGLIPASRDALVIPGVRRDPMLFELLEPAPHQRPEFNPRYSRLQKLVLTPKARLWVIAGGIFLVFLGLLPKTKARA